MASRHNPTWMEIKHILVTKLEGNLNLHLFDYNGHRSNKKIATTSFDLSVLKDDAAQEGMVGRMMEGDKDHGELRYDVKFYPALTDTTEGETNDSSKSRKALH